MSGDEREKRVSHFYTQLPSLSYPRCSCLAVGPVPKLTTCEKRLRKNERTHLLEKRAQKSTGPNMSNNEALKIFFVSTHILQYRAADLLSHYHVMSDPSVACMTAVAAVSEKFPYVIKIAIFASACDNSTLDLATESPGADADLRDSYRQQTLRVPLRKSLRLRWPKIRPGGYSVCPL